MYCFMMMATIRPGAPTDWEPNGRGSCTSYNMKIIQGETEAQLLERFIGQAEIWLKNHPERESLGITDFSVEHVILRFPKLVLFEGTAEFDLPDVFHNDYTVASDGGIKCVIGVKDCWGHDFDELMTEMNNSNIIPFTPAFFDSVSIESAQAWEMLRGSASDSANCWNRTGWKMKYNIDRKAGFVEEINGELEQISSDPHIGSFTLKYFQGAH